MELPEGYIEEISGPDMMRFRPNLSKMEKVNNSQKIPSPSFAPISGTWQACSDQEGNGMRANDHCYVIYEWFNEELSKELNKVAFYICMSFNVSVIVDVSSIEIISYLVLLKFDSLH